MRNATLATPFPHRIGDEDFLADCGANPGLRVKLSADPVVQGFTADLATVWDLY